MIYDNRIALRLDDNYRVDETGNVVSFGMVGSLPESIGNLKQLSASMSFPFTLSYHAQMYTNTAIVHSSQLN
jgi:hypothetical protein